MIWLLYKYYSICLFIRCLHYITIDICNIYKNKQVMNIVSILKWKEIKFVSNVFSNMVCTGAYDEEDAAARAYDLAALKYWGRDTILNFPVNFLWIQTNTNTNLIRKYTWYLFALQSLLFSWTNTIFLI